MSENEFWYNTRTGQVEEGAQSDWSQLLGPYGSRQEAEGAMAKVAANNEAADAADDEDSNWDNNLVNDTD